MDAGSTIPGLGTEDEAFFKGNTMDLLRFAGTLIRYEEAIRQGAIGRFDRAQYDPAGYGFNCRAESMECGGNSTWRPRNWTTYKWLLEGWVTVAYGGINYLKWHGMNEAEMLAKKLEKLIFKPCH